MLIINVSLTGLIKIKSFITFLFVYLSEPHQKYFKMLFFICWPKQAKNMVVSNY